jgi:membrane protein implicated in regulation of membrane protease activity
MTKWWINLISGLLLLIAGILTRYYIMSFIGIIIMIVAWARYSKVKKTKYEKM